MKKILLLFVAVIILTGCGKLSDLPENPAKYTIGTVMSKDKKTSYTAIVYDGKYFIAYGNVKPGFLGDLSYAYGECLGYVGGDENNRIYELKGSSKDEWIIEYYVNGEMEQPMVFREVNVKDGNDPSSVEAIKDDNYFNQKK